MVVHEACLPGAVDGDVQIRVTQPKHIDPLVGGVDAAHFNAWLVPKQVAEMIRLGDADLAIAHIQRVTGYTGAPDRNSFNVRV